MTHEDVKKFQDNFLVDLNHLAGVPDLSYYDKSRQPVDVDEVTMDRMEKRAYDYKEFIREVNKDSIENHIYNENWGFDVIRSYYRVQN